MNMTKRDKREHKAVTIADLCRQAPEYLTAHSAIGKTIARVVKEDRATTFEFTDGTKLCISVSGYGDSAPVLDHEWE